MAKLILVGARRDLGRCVCASTFGLIRTATGAIFFQARRHPVDSRQLRFAFGVETIKSPAARQILDFLLLLAHAGEYGRCAGHRRRPGRASTRPR